MAGGALRNVILNLCVIVAAAHRSIDIDSVTSESEEHGSAEHNLSSALACCPPSHPATVHAMRLLHRYTPISMAQTEVSTVLSHNLKLADSVSRHLEATRAGGRATAKLRAQLLARAHAALGQRGSQLSKLDRTVSRKDTTECVCFLEKIKVGELEIKIADLDSAGDHENRGHCSYNCPHSCHSDLKFKLDPDEARKMGAELPVPMTASKCSDDGECKCLDATEAAWRANQLGADVTKDKGHYDSTSDCLKECECGDLKVMEARDDGVKMKWDWEGLCLEEWNDEWYNGGGRSTGHPRWGTAGLLAVLAALAPLWPNAA